MAEGDFVHGEYQPTARIVVVARALARVGTGGDLRDLHLLAALRRVGTVEVFVAGSLTASARAAASDHFGVPVHGGRSTNHRWPATVLRYLTRRDLPARAARTNHSADLEELRPLVETASVVVCWHAAAYLAVHRVVSAPIITDFDDFQSELIAQRRELDATEPAHPRPLRPQWKFVLQWALGPYLRIEQARWRRAERAALAGSRMALVCSDADRSLAYAADNVHVVGNGFDTPCEVVDHRSVGHPPTLTFWGLMSYPPNRDGALWFLTNVWPIVKQQLPAARLRIIGSGSEQLGISTGNDVEVHGFVDDLSPWLTASDVAIVPLRMGGGTRIKIVEAWANGLPVVSTTIGAHGLRLDGSNDLLIADTATEFADAVVRALEDTGLRDRMIDAGIERARSLDWQTVEQRVEELVRAVLAPDATSSSRSASAASASTGDPSAFTADGQTDVRDRP